MLIFDITNGLQFLKVLFWEEMDEFYFLANYRLCMLLSVVNDQGCQVFFCNIYSHV